MINYLDRSCYILDTRQEECILYQLKELGVGLDEHLKSQAFTEFEDFIMITDERTKSCRVCSNILLHQSLQIKQVGLPFEEAPHSTKFITREIYISYTKENRLIIFESHGKLIDSIRLPIFYDCKNSFIISRDRSYAFALDDNNRTLSAIRISQKRNDWRRLRMSVSKTILFDGYSTSLGFIQNKDEEVMFVSTKGNKQTLHVFKFSKAKLIRLKDKVMLKQKIPQNICSHAGTIYL